MQLDAPIARDRGVVDGDARGVARARERRRRPARGRAAARAPVAAMRAASASSALGRQRRFHRRARDLRGLADDARARPRSSPRSRARSPAAAAGSAGGSARRASPRDRCASQCAPRVEDAARARVGREAHEAQDVVRSAGLRARADRRVLPAAERLAPHDRAGGVAVDVRVADLDAFEPVLDLVGVEAVQPAGRARTRLRSAARARRRGRGRASRRAPARSTRCGGTTSRAARRSSRPASTAAPTASSGTGLDEPLLARVEFGRARGGACPTAGSTIGPIIVARSSAGPTRTLRTASASRARNRASS